MTTLARWKYALGLELTNTGFDASVLSEFRTRLITGELEEFALTRLLEHCQAQDLLRAGGKQCTDSTHVLAAVRQLNRLVRILTLSGQQWLFRSLRAPSPVPLAFLTTDANTGLWIPSCSPVR